MTWCIGGDLWLVGGDPVVQGVIIIITWFSYYSCVVGNC